MHEVERAVLLILLIGGMLWLRGRSRKLDLGKKKNIVLFGIFVVLPSLLLGEKLLFEHLPFGPAANIPIKAAMLAATFAAVGYGFLRPSPSASDRVAGTPAAPSEILRK